MSLSIIGYVSEGAMFPAPVHRCPRCRLGLALHTFGRTCESCVDDLIRIRAFFQEDVLWDA